MAHDSLQHFDSTKKSIKDFSEKLSFTAWQTIFVMMLHGRRKHTAGTDYVHKVTNAFILQCNVRNVQLYTVKQ